MSNMFDLSGKVAVISGSNDGIGQGITIGLAEAGADIVLMPDDLDEAYKAVRAAVESGELSEEEIDAKLIRILKLKDEYQI